MNRFNSLVFSALLSATGIAQSPDPKGLFNSPLEIPLTLSGNFMELRTGHFHSGLDMRTDGREGLPVKAAEDGWVSRIKVSPWGYGKAVYIDHPNGYTTVYGHLRNYTGAIADAALDKQYAARSFEVDAAFDKGALPVKKGEIIAYSGNSGGSSGPHLHFEVRRTSDQHALDPERFGLDVPDTVSPTIFGLRIDPLDSNARVEPYPGRARGWVAEAQGKRYGLKGGIEPHALGMVGLSVHVIDRYNDGRSTCGIRALRVRVDNIPVYSAQLNEIDFGTTRFADAYMDYALFKGNDMNYHRCYKLPNNKLRIYGKEAAQGRIQVTPGQVSQVEVEAEDAHGSISTLRFTLRGADPAAAQGWASGPASGQLFHFDRENHLNTPEVRFTLPPDALYADERITCSSRPGKSPFAPLTRLHDPLTPLNLAGQLALKVDPSNAKGRTDKLLIVRMDEKGKASPTGGTYADGWVSAKVRSFGDYTVLIDTVPPKVVAVDLKPVMTGRDGFSIQVSDDLSGIDQWVGRLDGTWILFEYDPKKRSLTHTFDKHSAKAGEHELVLEVSDERGNVSTLRSKFKR